MSKKCSNYQLVRHWGSDFFFLQAMTVSEHMGWVRNVILMNVYLGLGKPQGVGISGGGPDGQVRET
jgi:hypothetical protein